MQKKRIIVGISGASGIIYGIRLLEILSNLEYETHLIVSKAAQQTRAIETQLTASELANLANFNYSIHDISAAVASGSFRTEGMIIAPCSMRSLAAIAAGASNNLLTRAADVVLKERRKLVLLVRETPFHLIHLENMKKVTESGAIVAPPIPAFYMEKFTDLLEYPPITYFRSNRRLLAHDYQILSFSETQAGQRFIP